MDYEQIVLKLVGQINPTGESHLDGERLENLKNLCELTDKLISKIYYVADNYKTAHEYSIKQSQGYAKEFLLSQAESINNYL